MAGGSIAFDRIADRYDETRGGVVRGRLVSTVLAPHLPTGTTVLEIGVGTGAVALPLRADHGLRVVGIDLSVPMLVRAKERIGPRVARGDAMQLPVAGASVGGAVASWVLHLVGDRPTVLRELARVVQPGGTVVVVDSQPDWGDDDELERIFRRLTVLRPRPTTEELVQGCDELELDQLLPTPTEPFEQSPNAVAQMVEERTWASLWDLDDERWEAVVAPVIRDLRAMRDPDRPRARHARYPVAVLRRR